MWIATLNIGHKKIFVLLIISITVWAYATTFPFYLLTHVFTIIVTCWIILLYAGFVFGLYKRLHRFKTGNDTFDVIDFYLPKNPLENKRYILHIESNSVLSSIYLRKQTRWAYFDIIRHLVNSIKYTNKNRALILGGGGQSGYLYIQDCGFSHADIVEISKTMIHVARTYFKLSNTSKISYHNTSAEEFIKHTKQTYTLVFVDIFRGHSLDKQLVHASFLKQLQIITQVDGIVILNFGFLPNTSIQKVTHRLSGIKLYMWSKSLIGIWSPLNQPARKILESYGAYAIPA